MALLDFGLLVKLNIKYKHHNRSLSLSSFLFLNLNQKGVEIIEHEFKHCECENARTLVSCPGKQRIFLVVCAKFFQIFDASDFTILCHVSSKSDETYSSGYFIDLDKIVICLVNGTTYIYQLPEKFVKSCFYYHL